MKARAKKTRLSSTRKPKPSKLTYKELLCQLLTLDMLIEENKLISEIIYKKYGVKRARKSRKISVKMKLNEGESEGIFRSFSLGNKIFWKLGDGVAGNNEISTYEARARESAAKLEEFLLRVCIQKLEHAKRVQIPYRIEREIKDRHRGEDINSSDKKLKSLKYASISDLGWVITENWGFFEPTFIHKGSFVAKIKELNDYRRRLAHPNVEPMEREEMEYFTLAVSVFIKNAKV